MSRLSECAGQLHTAPWAAAGLQEPYCTNGRGLNSVHVAPTALQNRSQFHKDVEHGLGISVTTFLNGGTLIHNPLANLSWLLRCVGGAAWGAAKATPKA